MIRIAAITLASDSAITLAQFRPSKSLDFKESRAVARATSVLGSGQMIA